VYPRPPKESQNAGKFVWQILYRTKEKCLETILGYVTKKLAKWFGRDSCVKLKQNQVNAVFHNSKSARAHYFCDSSCLGNATVNSYQYAQCATNCIFCVMFGCGLSLKPISRFTSNLDTTLEIH
jgi:hypothetical protein